MTRRAPRSRRTEAQSVDQQVDHTPTMERAALAGGGGEVADCSQQLVRLDGVADLTGGYRRVEQRLKG